MKVWYAAAAMLFVVAQAGTSDESFRLHIPIEGRELVDWAISYLVDHGSGDEIADHEGGLSTYEGHKGTDFNLPNFLYMDAGVAVRAAASGTVIEIRDGQFDRNMSRRNCDRSMRPNYVTIEHENGYRSEYLHLKKGSIVVSLGQEVSARQKIGEVGSSGCSGDPHLHFELVDQGESVVDPFADELWINAPSHDYPMTIFGYSVNARKLESGDDIKEPDPNITTVRPGTTVGVGMTVLSWEAGGSVRVVVRNGGTVYRKRKVLDRYRPVRYQGWNFDLDRKSGTWDIFIFLNQETEPEVHHRVRVVPR